MYRDKNSNSQCYAPSSEPFGAYLDVNIVKHVEEPSDEAHHNTNILGP
jgi:hypothetical protein